MAATERPRPVHLHFILQGAQPLRKSPGRRQRRHAALPPLSAGYACSARRERRRRGRVVVGRASWGAIARVPRRAVLLVRQNVLPFVTEAAENRVELGAGPLAD
jgi:hypothetical protein